MKKKYLPILFIIVGIIAVCAVTFIIRCYYLEKGTYSLFGGYHTEKDVWGTGKEAEKAFDKENRINTEDGSLQARILTESEYEQLLACMNSKLMEMGYALPSITEYGTKSINRTSVSSVLPFQGSENKAAKEMKELARTLNISEYELNRMIAESRSYTDEIYKELSEKFDASDGELRELISEGVKNNDLEKTANELGTSEEKLYAAIAATKDLTDKELEALADKLHMDGEELKRLLHDVVQKISNDMEASSKEINSRIDSNKTKSDSNAAFLQKNIDNIQQSMDSNKELTDKDLADFAQLLGVNAEELKTLIYKNKAEADSTTASLRDFINILQYNISSNKNLADQEITGLVNAMGKLTESLQKLSKKAVQKESYDKDSNTLYLITE